MVELEEGAAGRDHLVKRRELLELRAERGEDVEMSEAPSSSKKDKKKKKRKEASGDVELIKAKKKKKKKSAA